MCVKLHMCVGDRGSFPNPWPDAGLAQSGAQPIQALTWARAALPGATPSLCCGRCFQIYHGNCRTGCASASRLQQGTAHTLRLPCSGKNCPGPGVGSRDPTLWMGFMGEDVCSSLFKVVSPVTLHLCLFALKEVPTRQKAEALVNEQASHCLCGHYCP